MFPRIAAAIVLLFSFVPHARAGVPATAHQVQSNPHYAAWKQALERRDELLRPVRVLGKQTRKIIRHERYRKYLQGDKLQVFEAHGFTPFRLREDRGIAGVVERWRYPELGLEYVFAADGRQLEKRRIRRGDSSFD